MSGVSTTIEVRGTVDQPFREALLAARPKSASRVQLDLHWLAGLLEGEGSFASTSNQNGYISPRVTLVMTDRDIVARAAAIMGVSVREKTSPSLQRYARKRQWVAVVNGKAAAALMDRLAPLMGARRNIAIREAMQTMTAANVAA